MAKAYTPHGALTFYLPSEDQISERNNLWLSPLGLIDIPYYSASHEVLELVYVKYVLSKNGLILKTVCHLCPKRELNLATQDGFFLRLFSTQM